MENTIYGLFKEKVRQQPEATAIIENKRTLSFKELSAMVDMIADSFPDNPSGTNGYLMNIYSLPELRGEGIGRQIVEFLIDDAKSRGTEKIYLESSSMAKRLYHEIGFSDMIDYMKL